MSFRDGGRGMSAAQLEALFQPFNRLGREGSNIEGTGIGLVITKRLVELMGGTLGVRSEVDDGSEFEVELRGVRIVAVSASAMPAEIDMALAAGFDNYLTKPLLADRLFAEVDVALVQPRQGAVTS